MRLTIFLSLFLISPFELLAQTLADLSFGTDNTLEVITWNIEHFPKNGSVTITKMQQIMEALDADVYALQEIDTPDQLPNLLNGLTGYTAYHESVYYGGLVYLYKTSEVQITNIYEIYTSTTDPYRYNFPRKPMVMEMRFKDEDYIIINNHFKCCGDGILDKNDSYDEEYKRYYASNMIKDYIDTHFADKNVILVGDLNDILTDVSSNNVFQFFIDDPNNYKFADQEIAEESNSDNWSFPSWPSHIDHILITNELFNEMNNVNSSIQTIRIDDYLQGGLSEYDADISDHRPVAIRIMPSVNTSITNPNSQESIFYNYPNPFSTGTEFKFEALPTPSVIEVFDTRGQLIQSIEVEANATTQSWETNGLAKGIYLAKRMVNKEPVAELKLTVQ